MLFSNNKMRLMSIGNKGERKIVIWTVIGFYNKADGSKLYGMQMVILYY